MELFEELYKDLITYGPIPELEFAMELIIHNNTVE
jgi:hypothetical protein